jgi:hypothetical protein
VKSSLKKAFQNWIIKTEKRLKKTGNPLPWNLIFLEKIQKRIKKKRNLKNIGKEGTALILLLKVAVVVIVAMSQILDLVRSQDRVQNLERNIIKRKRADQNLEMIEKEETTQDQSKIAQQILLPI